MSLQGLISGSECALPYNPLNQVLKHTESDRSLQRDRVAGPSTSRLRHLPTTAVPVDERDLALSRQFFEANAGPSLHLQMPQLPPAEFARAMDTSLSRPNLNRPNLDDMWARAKDQARQGPARFNSDPESRWANEFGNAAPQLHAPGHNSSQMYSHNMGEYSSRGHYPSSQMYQSNMPMNMFGMGMGRDFTSFQQDKGKGKGKNVQEDFEHVFAQFESQFPAQTAKLEEVDDNVEGLQDAMQNITIQAEDEKEEVVMDKDTDFQTVWEQLQKSEIPPSTEDFAKWESQFNDLMSSQREDTDFGFAEDFNDFGDAYGIPDSSKFDDNGAPILDEYKFEANNPYLSSEPSRSLLQEAKKLLQENGSLTEAATMLEAAIQKGELGEGGYETWILLGEVRSMDEREDAAMRALSEGVRRAEQSGAKGEGMLSLAISYTNEGFERAAVATLLEWLIARYPTFSPPPETIASLKGSAWHAYDKVKDAYMGVARDQHSHGVVDPDLQTGLGVLFYGTSDFARAKDCFESALSVRPKDYLLWNRLGSCLSNGNQPEEALGAYREALQIRPTYTRAIYNVGVACLNIGAHKEACEHFLSALALQEPGDGEKSEQLWFTFRRALRSMNRDDLAERAVAGQSLESFRSEGFDF